MCRLALHLAPWSKHRSISLDRTSLHVTSCHPTPVHLNRECCDWSTGVTSQRTTEVAVAAINRDKLGTDEMRSVEMRSDDVR